MCLLIINTVMGFCVILYLTDQSNSDSSNSDTSKSEVIVTSRSVVKSNAADTEVSIKYNSAV